jgi:cellulose synthase/poly-beta-1,6-N-acetylglucosamine synthase-like glycosyltransferase
VTVDWLWWLQVAFILYFLLLNGMYLLLNLLSMGSLMGYIRQRAETGELAPYLGVEPPVSVLMPAFNEEATIRTSVRSMLQLQYPEFEIVVINDGSKDSTLAVLIEEFDLVPHPEPLRQAVAHQPVQAIYRSRRYANLRVVDKANGGKADALNAGINAARYGLFCGVDADSILQRDSLLRVVQPFLEDERTIAAGGTVRIANGSQVRGGFLIQAGLPRNWLARFQIVEYLRAFLFGRLGWSPLNAVLIISGAFGLFDRERVMAVGGYRTDTVGEDMELVVRLHRYHREKRIPYRIRYLPDPICWTECPENLGTLGRQRSRWQRGLAESLGRHARLAFSLRGGHARLAGLAVHGAVRVDRPADRTGRLRLHAGGLRLRRGVLLGAGGVPAGGDRHGHPAIGQWPAAGDHVLPRLQPPARHAAAIPDGRAGELRLPPAQHRLALSWPLAMVLATQAPLGRDAPQRAVGAKLAERSKNRRVDHASSIHHGCATRWM